MLSEAQKKANNKYFEKFDDIKVRVQAGKKAEYKAQAEAHGMSLNAYIIKLLEADKPQE
ncbi:MAG: toxin-antitoxin system HicB family antitoxin [Oscillospiraceae bacterium]